MQIMHRLVLFLSKSVLFFKSVYHQLIWLLRVKPVLCFCSSKKNKIKIIFSLLAAVERVKYTALVPHRQNFFFFFNSDFIKKKKDKILYGFQNRMLKISLKFTKVDICRAFLTPEILNALRKVKIKMLTEV